MPTAGHPSRVAAIRAYDARWPGAPADEVAWMLGCAVRDVQMMRAQDRARGPLKAKPLRKKTPAEVTRSRRERLRAQGLCVDNCGEIAAPGRDRCEGCLTYLRDRVATHRAQKAAA